MKVKEIHLRGFKRFADLKIQEILQTVKLVVLLGPNGCGKSSVFDAMLIVAQRNHTMRDPDYYLRRSSHTRRVECQDPYIHFHDSSSEMSEKSIYVRTAYRNDPDINVGHIAILGPAVKENRFQQMIANDAATTGNLQRLFSNSLQRAFNRKDHAKTLGQFQHETLGEIQEAMKRLFPDLVLNSLGNPSEQKTFRFDKGKSLDFPYKNLSGGEKAAFDLLLDIFVKRDEYDDTVFCIDEPEAHMHPRLQGKLLEELCLLINDKSQLWIATHAIGMMRKALELNNDKPGTVAFLDFGQCDFDTPQVIEPAIPDRKFWETTHEVALDDLGTLVVPKQIIICEGEHGGKGFDAECYNRIFSGEFPDAKFISAGGKSELKNYVQVIRAVAKGAKVFGLRDRDGATDEGRDRKEKEGIKVLQRHAIENYLLNDDVLGALCQKLELEDCQQKTDILIQLRAKDDENRAKAAAQNIFQQVKTWGAQNIGDDSQEFLRDIVAPLIKPGMATYNELKTTIFGGDNVPPP